MSAETPDIDLNPSSTGQWARAVTGALDGTAATLPIALAGVALVYVQFPAHYLSYGVLATVLALAFAQVLSAHSARPMVYSARLFEASAMAATLGQFNQYLPSWGLDARPQVLLALMCILGTLAALVCAVLFIVRADRFIRLVPTPVYIGFGISVALLLLMSQSKLLWHVAMAGGHIAMLLSVAVTAIGVNLAVRRYGPRWPASALGLVAASLVAWAWVAAGVKVTMVIDAQQALQLPWMVADFAALYGPAVRLDLLLPALLNAGLLLGLMVFINLNVATETISQVDHRYADRWQHVALALGCGLGAAWGAVPIAASPQATAVAMRASPLSRNLVLGVGVVCALCVVLGLLNMTALVAVAGVMLCDALFMIDRPTAKRMGEWARGHALARHEKEDLGLIAAVAAAAVLANAVVAVMVGLLFGLLMFALRHAKAPVRFQWTGEQVHSNTARSRADIAVLARYASQLRVLELENELFFGVSSSLERSLKAALTDGTHTVVLDWTRVRNVDSSIGIVLQRWARSAAVQNIRILHAGASLQKGNAAAFLTKHLPDASVWPDLDRAMEAAENGLISHHNPAPTHAATTLQEALHLFKGLTAVQRNTLEDAMRFKLFKTGEVVYQSGDASDSMVIVLNGSAEIIVQDQSAQAQAQSAHSAPVRLTSVRRGGVIGEIGMLDGAKRSATVIAQEDLLVHELTRSAFDQLCQSDPSIVYLLMRNLALDLAVRLRHTNRMAIARHGYA